MPSTAKNSKKCATCQYWSGARQIQSKFTVHYDSNGICTASRSNYKGKQTSGGQYCGHWSKWVAID